MEQQSAIRVFDLHSDIASDITSRRARGERQVFKNRHYPRLKQSGVQALVSVLWVEPEYRDKTFGRFIQLFGALLADLDECQDCVQLVQDEKALSDANRAGKIGLFLGLEGMSFVEHWPKFGSDDENPSADTGRDTQLHGQLSQALAILTPFHIRYAILVWGERNQIASGPGRFYRPEYGAGLTPFGRHTVRELQRRDILIDLSHLDDTSIDDVLDVSEGRILASHSNARALCDAPRNLLDRHIEAIGSRGGLIGLNAYPEFVDKEHASLDRFIDHLIYIADKIGIEHVAFGFDFVDYLPGYENRRRSEPDTVESVPGLIKRLHERGLTEKEIEQVTWKNAVQMVAK